MSIKKVKTKEDFDAFIKKLEKKKKYKQPLGFGIARVDKGQLNSEKILQACFPLINWNENFASAVAFLSILDDMGIDIDFSDSEFVCEVDKKFVKKARKIFSPFLHEAKGDKHKNVQVLNHLHHILQEDDFENSFCLIFIFEDEKPKSVEAVYMKLYALSQGKAKLRSLNLDGAFGLLENVAWSNGYPIELDWLRENEIELKLNGTFPSIESVDKFPRFLQHVIPQNNTRILDSSKVRMGAQLASGTTVMPGASYINFNAGTEGSVMVEGRISSSAIVGDGSDVGGGASILGVLSGTNGNPIQIGKNTLLGANSVTGIPLGDGCIVDAGVSILEGSKISINKDQANLIQEINPSLKFDRRKNIVIFKGIELAGCHGIHFRQDSQTGALIGLRSKKEVKLNEDLHV